MFAHKKSKYICASYFILLVCRVFYKKKTQKNRFCRPFTFSCNQNEHVSRTFPNILGYQVPWKKHVKPIISPSVILRRLLYGDTQQSRQFTECRIKQTRQSSQHLAISLFPIVCRQKVLVATMILASSRTPPPPSVDFKMMN